MANHLVNETSPYLLQHANNPVDWYPWNEEALTKAKQSNKPILLSIGYSACHWCHVMAHESFEDPQIAKLMNDYFINIKVDREERPDLDKIYQMAHQLLTHRPGGWPLTVFLTPDQVPFFAGTYFPTKAMQGMPSFSGLLRSIAQTYHEKQAEIIKNAAQLLATLEKINAAAASAIQLDGKPIDEAVKVIAKEYDIEHGGFGNAPKFPQTGFLHLLLNQFLQQQDTKALGMVATSLTKMAEGGLFDQLGGGFFRYSVDAGWQIPHFEKMLYDNALLLDIYIEAYLITKNHFFKTIAIATAEWLTTMQSDAGGFFATLDADSEGIEGKFYSWHRQEVQQLLSETEYKIAESYFDLNQSANFETEWHFHIAKNPHLIAKELKIPEKSVTDSIHQIIQTLLTARAKRIWPHRDEKVLAAWNGLAIKAMAKAGQYLDPKYLKSAERVLNFIHTTLYQNNKLFAVYSNGHAMIEGYLDDYVFVIAAILSYLQVQWKIEYFNFAIQLADYVLQHFQDKEKGGFYFTADDQVKLIYRPKSYADEAVPSGNAVAALVFNQLGYITGKADYLQASETTLASFGPQLQQYPEAFATALLALMQQLQPPTVIIIRGEASEFANWRNACQQYFSPQHLVFFIPNDAGNLPDYLAGKKAVAKGCVAYICQGKQCLTPVTTVEALVDFLQSELVLRVAKNKKK